MRAQNLYIYLYTTKKANNAAGAEKLFFFTFSCLRSSNNRREGWGVNVIGNFIIY